MIISRTPLRVSFLGGGTDFPDYYLIHGGAVLSTTIDKYIYVVVKERFDDRIVLHYTRTEDVENVKDIQHDIIREILEWADIERGIEITTMADIPTEGTGLGSSSSLIVGLIHALYKYNNIDTSASVLAEEAYNIEADRMGKCVGKQDHYAAAYGGLRFMFFGEDISAYRPKDIDIYALMRRITLFYTGTTRSAETILQKQRDNIGERLPQLAELQRLAYAGMASLKQGNYKQFGSCLNRAWSIKKQLADGITNDTINDMENLSRDNTLGVKVCGAGGGGFFLALSNNLDKVRHALRNYREFPVQYEPEGSKIVYDGY